MDARLEYSRASCLLHVDRNWPPIAYRMDVRTYRIVLVSSIGEPKQQVTARMLC